MSALWGIPYLFIKVAIDDGISPGFIAWSRVILAALVLLPLAWRTGEIASLRGRWGWVVFFAFFEIALAFPLISAGEKHVDSSLAAIIIASVPLLVAVLAIRFDQSERVRGTRLFGLLIGFAGVVALVGIDVAGRSDELLGAMAILLAAACYAVGSITLKRQFSDINPIVTMAAALSVASVFLAPLGLATIPTEAPSQAALISIVVLGLLCTAIAFVVYGALIAEVGAGRATVITYVAPVVALACGIVVLGEQPGAGAVVGLLLILAGSWLSTDGRLPPGTAAIVTRWRRRLRRERPSPIRSSASA